MNRDFAAGFLAGIALLFLVSVFFFPAYSVEIISSPGAESEIVSLIDSSSESVYVDVYILTSEEVVDSLISAYQRGVDVRVILEHRVSRGANNYAFSRLSGAGIDVCWASDAYKLSHPKIMIIDGRKALVGSHNLSNSALNYNREVSLLVEGNIVREVLSLFESDWNACTFA
ncbi:MAG: phospholipase D-like domain-containing protein [Candidatus Micrarchaeia archaeon]